MFTPEAFVLFCKHLVYTVAKFNGLQLTCLVKLEVLSGKRQIGN